MCIPLIKASESYRSESKAPPEGDTINFRIILILELFIDFLT